MHIPGKMFKVGFKSWTWGSLVLSLRTLNKEIRGFYKVKQPGEQNVQLTAVGLVHVSTTRKKKQAFDKETAGS